MNWQTMLFISVNGEKDKDTVEENKFGLMDQNMKDIGKIIWQMEKED